MEFDKSDMLENLEALLDHTSMWTMLDCLSALCDAKAIHVEQEWQDMGLAYAWLNMSEKLAKLRDTQVARHVSGR